MAPPTRTILRRKTPKTTHGHVTTRRSGARAQPVLLPRIQSAPVNSPLNKTVIIEDGDDIDEIVSRRASAATTPSTSIRRSPICGNAAISPPVVGRGRSSQPAKCHSCRIFEDTFLLLPYRFSDFRPLKSAAIKYENAFEKGRILAVKLFSNQKAQVDRAEMIISLPKVASITKYLTHAEANTELLLDSQETPQFLLVGFEPEPHAKSPLANARELYHLLQCENKVARLEDVKGSSHRRHYLLPYTKHKYLPCALHPCELNFEIEDHQLGFIWIVAQPN
ncbi:hypothetical protein QR680_013621 [Steinernema hermaphroditum]|uniref:Uncharacterized protein n=1 Tax=Steinernema hermaphroditum TaxID=289476 RepID=A0AA39M2N8_9BILA|nr:hypothetical protein QR680_013621 [Steinernema hermaphroditum]